MPEPTLYARLTTLEERPTHLEAMTEVVTAIRSDIATIAQESTRRLKQHVVDLDDRVDKHALPIGRLLDATPLTRPRDEDT
jgi:hypothetical protein